MDHRLVFAGLALLALMAFAPAPLPKKKPRTLPDAIQGTWVLVREEQDGAPVRQKGRPEVRRVRIEGKTWTLVRERAISRSFSLDFDTSKTPCWLDIHGADGAVNWITLYRRGIVTLDGDTLRYCFLPKASEERPKSFDTTKTAGTLWTLKRE